MIETILSCCFLEQGSMMELHAGADEAGRGPLAGPVFAAAVILPPEYHLPKLGDSKKLSAAQRERLFDAIIETAVAYSITQASVEEIDELNILQASLLAMKRAVLQLSTVPQHVWVDGNHAPQLPMSCTAVIQGDATVPCISAASILAKVARDRLMEEMHLQYPEYGFRQHKGYPTAVHLQAIQNHGILPIHRKSFGPVKRLLTNIETVGII